MDQKGKSSYNKTLKTLKHTQQKRILKAAMENYQVTYKDRPVRITLDFSIETLGPEGPGQMFCKL